MKYTSLNRAMDAASPEKSFFLASASPAGKVFSDNVDSVDVIPTANRLNLFGNFKTLTLTNIWDNNNVSLMIHEKSQENCFVVVGQISEIVPCDENEPSDETHALMLILRPKNVFSIKLTNTENVAERFLCTAK